MAGVRLVVRRGGEMVQGPLPQIRGVHVVDARPRVVGRGRLVEGERHVGFPVLLDRPNLAVRGGHAAEEPRGRLPTALNLKLREAHHLLSGSRAVVPAGLVLGERGLRVVEPQPFRGTAPFLLDPVEVLQPNAMDLLGRKRERGPGPDLGRVHLLAPVEGPEPDGLRGVGPVVAKDAEEAFVGGHDPVRDHRHEPVVFLLPDVAERRDGRGVGRVGGHQAFGLRDGAVDHHFRHRLPHPHPVPGHLPHLVEVGGDRLEAAEVALPALGRVHALPGGKLGDQPGRPPQVQRGREPVEPVLDGVQVPEGDGLQDVEGGPGRDVERGTADARQVRDGPPLDRLPTGQAGLAGVGETVVVPFVSHLGPEDRLELEQVLPVPVDQFACILLVVGHVSFSPAVATLRQASRRQHTGRPAPVRPDQIRARRARKAFPRWLIRSFSRSLSSAIVRRRPLGTKIGS